MFFVPHFGHAKVYETSIWTPCFQISAKTLLRVPNISLSIKGVNGIIDHLHEQGHFVINTCISLLSRGREVTHLSPEFKYP